MTTDKPNHNRLSQLEGRSADPTTLVGSFFHGQGSKWHGTQGCVVAEPAPGMYLVEFFSWLLGDSTEQRLIPITDMTEWLFYDDAQWMSNAYDHGVAQRWENERNEAEQS